MIVGRSLSRDKARFIQRALAEFEGLTVVHTLFGVLIHVVKPNRRKLDEYMKHYRKRFDAIFRGLKCFAYRDSASDLVFVYLLTANSPRLGSRSVVQRLECSLRNDRAYPNQQFGFALSDVHSGIESFGAVYQELIYCLRYASFYELYGRLVSYAGITNLQSHFSLPKTFADELRMRVTEGDLQKARAVLDKLITRNSFGRNRTIETSIFMIMTLLSTIRRVAFDSKTDESYANTLRSAENLLSCATFAEMAKLLYDTLDKVCMYMIKKHGQKHLILSSRVINHIELNYFDPSLDVNSLGSHFGMTPAYLSRIFRNQTRSTISHYINLVRTNNAKLLLDRNMKLEEVSSHVGFGSVNTLIRVFNKIEGTTPGQYKRQSHSLTTKA
jgi:YesN/AraC family two-component response regulator